MEQMIGTTELRQHLTDVLHAVREERATYVVSTFERSQAALINLDDYRQFQAFQREREAFFDWINRTAAQNSARNVTLTNDEVLAIIDQARSDVNAAPE